MNTPHSQRRALGAALRHIYAHNWRKGLCAECGRFCHIADVGIFYGSCTDMEPPEPEFFCTRCAVRKLNQAIKNPTTVSINCWWVKPYYVSVAKAVLRHKRKIEGKWQKRE